MVGIRKILGSHIGYMIPQYTASYIYLVNSSLLNNPQWIGMIASHASGNTKQLKAKALLNSKEDLNADFLISENHFSDIRKWSWFFYIGYIRKLTYKSYLALHISQKQFTDNFTATRLVCVAV